MTDPYRPPPSRPRYRVTIDGEIIEADRFVEVAKTLRRMGYSASAIRDIGALVVATSPEQRGHVTVELDADGLPIRQRCRRCQGAGVPRWEAFVSGLAWLIAGWAGVPVGTPRCRKCGGTGRVI